jgi:hypothetical protein
MNEKRKQGLRVFEAALLLGVLGDGLLRATPWGLNVLLWAGALASASVFFLARRRRSALAGSGHWLLLLAMLFAAAFAWRDSLTLNLLAGLGLLIALALLAWRARAGRIWLAGVSEYALGILLAGVNTFVSGFPLLCSNVHWQEVTGAGWTRHLRAVLRGALIALPLLIFFGGLLMAADAVFARAINNLFFTNHTQTLSHLLVAFLLAWISGGFLYGLLFGREVKWTSDGRARLEPLIQQESRVAETASASGAPQALKPQPISLGIIEIGVTLGLLNLLFLLFVIVQFRYFFGGAALVQDSDGLTYAEYYRRGFFELVTVAALVLPVLLVAHWLLRKGKPAHERIFRLLAGMQVFLLFVIMASAVRRMLLYQSEYGLTELRLYTTAFMAWLALVFIWFVATALRGKREQFACGALVAGLLVIATLHIINPDALIVRVNVAHAQAGRGFDARYAASLSADAAPALMESLPMLNAQDQRYIANTVLARWSSSEAADWRSWNWSRAQRWRIVQENLYALSAAAAPPNVNEADELADYARAQNFGTATQAKPLADQTQNLVPREKITEGAKGAARQAHRRKPNQYRRRVSVG